ncbi:MAG: hypothetical protein HQ515_17260 [Phycisphaeraceae bacterium]|nr:hypothetical protein [Phycisphaeraceae bacterium]
MSATDTKGRLVEAAKILNARWQDVQELWRDTNSHRFEKQVMDPLALEIKNALLAMDQIDMALTRARRDCGTREEFSL